MNRIKLTHKMVLITFLLILSFSLALAEGLAHQIYLPVIYSYMTPTSTTPPPEPTPTNTQPAPPTGVQIIGGTDSYFVDSIDYIHIVGEVKNYTSNYVNFVKITANFYNSEDQFIDTDFTYIHLDSLPPNEKTCFHIIASSPADFSNYRFEPPTYDTNGSPLPNITILNDHGSYDSIFGWYEIIGEARNDQGSRVEYVSPVATLYDNNNFVIGCDLTFVNSTHLDPGQTSSFKITFYGRDYTDVNHYRIQVDGIIQ